MSNCPPTNVKFKLRRANACDWLSSNPILQAGEPGFEADTYRLKIGDGVHNWKALPYIGGECMVFDGGFPSTQYIGQPVFDCGGIVQVTTPTCGHTQPVPNCGCSNN